MYAFKNILNYFFESLFNKIIFNLFDIKFCLYFNIFSIKNKPILFNVILFKFIPILFYQYHFI